MVTLKQQENHLWVAEAHTSPRHCTVPPSPALGRARLLQ